MPTPNSMKDMQQPLQLLKYSAISRCGMVCRQVTSTGSDHHPQDLRRVLVPKVNQDSFKVIKGFPKNTKPFNWMFQLFDGHGPHGELMSQLATKLLPDLLDKPLSSISNKYYERLSGCKNEEDRDRLIS